MINFDDFLSVVNDAQLNSLLNTYKEITQLMKRASEQKKRNVGEKINVRLTSRAVHDRTAEGDLLLEIGTASASIAVPAQDAFEQ